MANHRFATILTSVPLDWTIVAQEQHVETLPDIINVFNTLKFAFKNIKPYFMIYLKQAEGASLRAPIVIQNPERGELGYDGDYLYDTTYEDYDSENADYMKNSVPYYNQIIFNDFFKFLLG